MRRALIESGGADGNRFKILMEEPIYEGRLGLVTTARVVLNGRNYSVQGIRHVSIRHARTLPIVPTVMLISCGLLAGAIVTASVGLLFCAIFLTAAGLAFPPAVMHQIDVELENECVTVRDRDAVAIAEIADAIAVATRSQSSEKHAVASAKPMALAANA
jgi:hypothetical protein